MQSRHRRWRHRRLLHGVSPGEARQDRRAAAGAGPADQRHHLARGGAGRQMRPNRTMTQMSKYGIELYATLERRPASHRLEAMRQRQRGEDPGPHEGAAASSSPGAQFRRGVPRDLAGRGGRERAVLRTDDLQGALWLPGDGKANPADLCMSLAKGARKRGVKIVEGVEVTGVHAAQGRVTGVAHRAGRVDLRSRSSTAAASGRASSARWPASTCRSIPPSTSTSSPGDPRRARRLPVLRDPDGFIYYKEEVGGLVMGGFEPQAKPWRVDPIPIHVPVPAARRGLGPVRDPDEERDPPHAVPGDRESRCC